MKIHKRQITQVLAILLSITYPLITKAQKTFNYGIKAGLNLSSTSYNLYFYDTKSIKPGFQIGLTGEYGLIKSLFVQSEIAFTTKGVVYRGADAWIGGSNPPITHWKNTFDLMYLQIPLKLAYKFDVGEKTRLFVNAGAYAAHGLIAKDKTKNHYTGVEKDDDEQNHSLFKDRSLKRFDMGIITGLGAEFGLIAIGINYEPGLKDIGTRMPNSSNDFEYRNRNISFTLGYKL